MNLAELIPYVKSIDAAKDDLGRSIVAELLLISRIPEQGEIAVDELIDLVLEDSKVIQDEVMSFDFAYWAQGTVVEIIDFLITCGVADGPSVDMTTESHLLLEGKISRSELMDDYVDEILEEISEHEDTLGDICDD